MKKVPSPMESIFFVSFIKTKKQTLYLLENENAEIHRWDTMIILGYMMFAKFSIVFFFSLGNFHLNCLLYKYLENTYLFISISETYTSITTYMNATTKY